MKVEGDKNFGLSELEFEQLISDLKRNDTLFFEKVFLSQFEETMQYLKRAYKASHSDAYDAVMDALLDFRKRFVEGKLSYGNLRFLFTKMASQYYFRKSKISTEPLGEVDFPLLIDESDEDQHLLNQLEKAFLKLGEGCRNLLEMHFYGKMKLIEIAEQQEKDPSTIRKQKERCMSVLKSYFKNKSKILKYE